jgi:hypothetical protein
VVPVLRVDDQNCGCWRITVERPSGRDPNPEVSSTMQVYGATCPWPHIDRINYTAAVRAAQRPRPGRGRRTDLSLTDTTEQET